MGTATLVGTAFYEWFDLRRVVRVTFADKTWWGVTTILSEVGAEVALTQAGFPTVASGESLPVTVEIVEEKLELAAQITQTGFNNEFPTLRVAFEQMSLSQQRHLIEMLFCRPGEFGSLLLLVKILLRPRVLFDRDREVSAIAVSKV